MVSTVLDDFILDKDSTIWIATLNDDTVVYQDDGRYPDSPVAWKRLKQYCEQNKLFVKNMKIKFRSHTEDAGSSDEGFFFRYGCLSNPYLQKTFQEYVTGPIIDGKIHIKRWRIPEIITDSFDNEVREIIERDYEAIIWNLNLESRENLVNQHTT